MMPCQGDAEPEKRAREFVQRVKRNFPWLFSKEGNKRFFHGHMEVQDVRLLVDLARDGEKKALEILRKLARQWHQEAIRAGRGVLQVPTSLHELALEVFIYGPPKAKRGPKATHESLRYAATALLVKIVNQDFGFPVYANVEHRGDKDAPMTALRLVGEELDLSERTIEDI